jgi:hypothetical protein
MKKYEVCIIHREYRWVDIEAESEAQAKTKAWEMLCDGHLGEAHDADSEIRVEGEITEENDDA